MKAKGVLLVVMDGWGLTENEFGNAIKAAKKPNFDRLWNKYPHATLKCSGKWVGLPDGQMGTSEVNHLTIGAGRVIFQDLVRINKAIENGEFFANQALNEVMEQSKKNNSVLHLMGLVSDGGVHSHFKHLYALLKLAKDKGLKKVLVHVFTDGRDTRPSSGKGFVEDLEQYLSELKIGEIADVSGRYFAMDRDHNWERTDKVYRMLTERQGKEVNSAVEAVRNSYQEKISDEFIDPVMVKTSLGAEAKVKPGDSCIFFNFRNDRPRQLMDRFLQLGPKEVNWATMGRYHPDYSVKVAYAPMEMQDCLGEVLAVAKIKQLRVTETEKFAHLSFFLNCKREEAFEGEDRVMLDSYSDIKTHDERPEMRAEDITKEVVKAMETKSHRVIFSNVCNCDMVGHTGNFQAAIKGVEATDKAIGAMVKSGLEQGYAVMITADHGNCEEMIDEKTGEILTSHTTNPVPFILVSKDYNSLKRDDGSLIDMAPTMLTILGLKQPKAMTGKSLI